ncbi:hypothetical protein ABPG75_003119 [Micractinium tetrahymenae]
MVQPGYCVGTDAEPGGRCTRGPFTVGAGEVSPGPLITTTNSSFLYFGYALAADGSPLTSIAWGGNVASGDYQAIDPSTGANCSLSTTNPTATTSNACKEAIFGYVKLDGRNATGFQCSEECKAQWES